MFFLLVVSTPILLKSLSENGKPVDKIRYPPPSKKITGDASDLPVQFHYKATLLQLPLIPYFKIIFFSLHLTSYDKLNRKKCEKRINMNKMQK